MESLQLAVRKYLQYLLHVKSYSKETIRSYLVDYTQLFSLSPDFKESFWKKNSNNKQNTPPETLDETLLLRLIRENFKEIQTLKRSSVSRKIASLKSFLNWAFSERLLSQDLSEKFHTTKVPFSLPKHLSLDEAISFIKSIDNENDKLIILLLYGCGLRVSELIGLKTSDIKLSKKQLLVTGKGNKERIVAVPSGLSQWVHHVGS